MRSSLARRSILLASAAFLSFVPVACDDDDDDGGGVGRAETVPAVVMGPITGFGSVIVNGIELDVSNAEILIDGEAGSEADLGFGEIVTVDGAVDERLGVGTATRVVARSEVVGPVDAIDDATGVITVLGQPVITDEFTVFGGTTFETLMVGDVVRVSGFASGDLPIRATRIEAATAGTPLRVRGRVCELDANQETFMIRDLVIDFTGAELVNLPEGLANDQVVEVESATGIAGGSLRASRVVAAEDIVAEPGDLVSIEGFISRVLATDVFEVESMPVSVDDATLFEHGEVADLAPDARVGIVGVLSEDEVVVADEIAFRRAPDVRFEGTVTAVDAAGGRVSVLGQPFVIDRATIVDEVTGEGGQPIRLGDFAAGQRAIVIGFSTPSGELVATRLRRISDGAANEAFVFGPVTGVTQPDLEVVGVAVRTTAATEFFNSAGAPISAMTFFGAVADGDIVDVEGTFANDLLLANVVQLVGD